MAKERSELWTACPVVLDEPILILGLELDDVGLVAFAMILFSLVFSTILTLACTGALAFFLHKMKKGKAPGALLHRLHAIELVRLPGILGPRDKRYGVW